MGRRLLLTIALAAAPGLVRPVAAQEPAGGPATGYRIRTDIQEVIVDLIVRGKKGEPIRDLTADEVRVLEAGEPQQIISFRKIEGGEFERLGGSTEGPETQGRLVAPSSGGGQMRMAQLVSLVFERLGNNARRLAHRAARDFIRSGLRDNVFVAVYVLDRRLYPLVKFTNDLERVEQAIDTATGRNKTNFYAEAELVQRRLEEYLQKSGAADYQQAGARSNYTAPQSAPDVDVMLAQKAFEIARFSERLAREAEAGGSLFSLLALVRRQADLVGRKTVLLFSEGFQVPANYTAHLDTLVSEANRAQVSFYTIDARGLQTGSQLTEARRMLQEAAQNSRSQQELSISGAQRGLTQAEIRALDTAQDSIRSSNQGSLQEIAARTGGAFIGDTNNFSKPLARLSEDIFFHYEIAYRPPLEKWDGSFRPITVEVARPDAHVQTREGYYAIPPSAGDIVTAPFEMPLLAKLAEEPPPQDVSFNYRWWQFRSPSSGETLSFALKLPLAGVRFEQTEGEGNLHQQAGQG